MRILSRARFALKLIVLSMVLVACGARTEPGTGEVESAAQPAPCAEIVANGTVSGLVWTAPPAANGTIPAGEAVLWQPSTGSTISGQCWSLRSSPPSSWSDAQKICNKQDPTSCLRADAATGHLVTTSFQLATLFQIGKSGLWVTPDGTRQIQPPPAFGGSSVPVQIGPINTGAQPNIWLSNTPFFAQGLIATGYLTVDGALNVSAEPPTNNVIGGLNQPLASQIFTSTFLGLGTNQPLFSFASQMAGAGQTLAFLPNHGLSPILGHQPSGGSAPSVIATYILNVGRFQGVIFDDNNSDCAFSAANGVQTFAHPCGDASARPIVYNVAFAPNN